ncbi:MAG: esterase/lipase family protein [Myxococcaceae bacterium]
MLHVYLVPGFFGFANLGDLTYFGHVRSYLQEAFSALGLTAEVHAVKTHPTASIERRAARLLESIADTTGPSAGSIHLIGHSTGGLDARLFLSPNVQLPASMVPEPWAQRVKTLVTVSTPHHGTPLASFFQTVPGARLLQLLSLVTIHTLRLGSVPLAVLLKLGALFAKLDDLSPVNSPVLDQLFSQLLGDFSDDRKAALSQFFDEVSKDQSLIPQLAPEGMAEFNLRVHPRPGVQLASVLSCARRPGIGSTFAAGLDPAAQATHTVFSALHRIASGMQDSFLPPLNDQAREQIIRVFGEVLGADENDGIVPTRSQIFGEVLHAARADHHDIIGHFSDSVHNPPHYDWIATGTQFRRANFEAVWLQVAEFIAKSERGA